MKKTPRFAIVLIACLLLATPRAGHAQCELPGQPEAAGAAAIAAQTAGVTAMTAAIIAAVESTTNIARSAIVTAMDLGWEKMRDRMGKYATDLFKAEKDMAKQLSGGETDQTRLIGSITDASLAQRAMRNIQRAEVELHRQVEAPPEACTFDISGVYLRRAGVISRAASSAGANDMVARRLGRRGTPAAKGPLADIADRVQTNKDLFCNPKANGGKPGCTGDAGPFADAHVKPSATIFGKDTLDMSDPRTLAAVNEMARNLTGYKPQQIVAEDALKTASGRGQRMVERELAAQMDAVGSIYWGIVGERVPAGSAPEVQAMRMRIGANQPSSTPSEYEIRQQVVEQLWDPNYYAQLQNSAATTQQKQIYLRAYSVMQMYKLIEKMERISNAYAIQTSNLVDRYAPAIDSRANSRSNK